MAYITKRLAVDSSGKMKTVFMVVHAVSGFKSEREAEQYLYVLKSKIRGLK